MNTLIIDYGMGNLGSVKRAFEECDANAFISNDPNDLKSAGHIVLPGVGAFADGMANLHNMNWVPAIKNAASEGLPLLGICLGMQLLASKGYENGEALGLGLIPSEVKRLEPNKPSVRIPHMGWNEVIKDGTNNPLFDDIPNGSDFYFVHSYHVIPESSEHILATTPYCHNFVSAVNSENIFGVQFHPEKSGRPGLQLLTNFLKI